MTQLQANGQRTESEILDLLAETVKRVQVYGMAEAHNVYCRQVSDSMRLAFDLFLVRTKDPLAWEAGTGEYRFCARVQRMAFPGGSK